MARKPILFGFSVGCIALSLEMVAPAFLAPSAQAQTFRPPDRGTPAATAGGASRSACLGGNQILKVLVPNSQLGLTLTARPTFFVYVPQTTVSSGEFVLKDADDQDIYRMPVQLDGKPGILSLQLPASAPALQVDKDYRWYFSLICRPNDRLEDAFVGAWVRRVSPTAPLQQALRLGPPRTLPTVYANAGLWYDTMAALTNLRFQDSQDLSLKTDWMKLLESVGLHDLVGVPIVSNTNSAQTNNSNQ